MQIQDRTNVAQPERDKTEEIIKKLKNNTNPPMGKRHKSRNVRKRRRGVRKRSIRSY